MFIELLPLIESRPLTISVAALSEGRIRVNVFPRRKRKTAKRTRKSDTPTRTRLHKSPHRQFMP